MNIFNKLFKTKDPFYYLEWKHKGWGNRIEGEWDKDNVHFSGHLRRLPEVGDRIIFKMKSGKLGEVKLLKVKYFNDPKDMFFAEGKAIGYITNDKLDKIMSGQKKDEPEGFTFL